MICLVVVHAVQEALFGIAGTDGVDLVELEVPSICVTLAGSLAVFVYGAERLGLLVDLVQQYPKRG